MSWDDAWAWGDGGFDWVSQGEDGGAFRVPVSDGSFVLCHEVKRPVYEAAADYLDANSGAALTTAVRDAAWTEALLGGSRLFISQFLATDVVSGVARCELGMDPANTINFDNSLAACEAMGAGWTLMTQAQWHVLGVISQAYWSGQGKANPTGNTDHGTDYQTNAEIGIRSDALPVTGESQGSYGRTLTSLAEGGGQLLAWSHDGTANGVFDLVGNVWEWSSRVRIVDWEIQVLPASAGVQVDHSDATGPWQAILADGTLVTPGTANTLKYSTDSGVYLSEAQAGTGATTRFRSIGAGSIDPVPPILIAMGLFPYSSSVPVDGHSWFSNSGKRLPFRGGSWLDGSYAGVAALYLSSSRGSASSNISFRPAFVI